MRELRWGRKKRKRKEKQIPIARSGWAGKGKRGTEKKKTEEDKERGGSLQQKIYPRSLSPAGRLWGGKRSWGSLGFLGLRYALRKEFRREEVALLPYGWVIASTWHYIDKLAKIIDKKKIKGLTSERVGLRGGARKG